MWQIMEARESAAELKNSSVDLKNKESLMSRALILGTVLLASVNSSWAQATGAANKPNPPYPSDSRITFEWNYSCPGSRGCSFSCAGAGAGYHVTKLDVYLGTLPIGGDERVPAIFYSFSTLEFPRAIGFSISTGVGTISCQVNGMSLDYSGSPPGLDPALSADTSK
jgi:hypothetical protein